MGPEHRECNRATKRHAAEQRRRRPRPAALAFFDTKHLARQADSRPENGCGIA
jgi:hypothetical protein